MPDEPEVIQTMIDAGADPGFIDQVRKLIDPSPIRKERDEARKQAAEAQAEAAKYRNMAMGATFKEVGITGRPDLYNLPADLNATDPDAVRAWAADAGLVAPPPPATPVEEQAAHQRMVDASEGQAPPSSSAERDELLSIEDPIEFKKRAKAAGYLP